MSTLYLPVEEIIDNGFGIFTVCYNDVTKADNDFTDGLARLFQDGESIRAIVERFPFCPNYFKYMDKADELPFD